MRVYCDICKKVTYTYYDKKRKKLIFKCCGREEKESFVKQNLAVTTKITFLLPNGKELITVGSRKTIIKNGG